MMALVLILLIFGLVASLAIWGLFDAKYQPTVRVSRVEYLFIEQAPEANYMIILHDFKKGNFNTNYKNYYGRYRIKKINLKTQETLYDLPIHKHPNPELEIIAYTDQCLILQQEGYPVFFVIDWRTGKTILSEEILKRRYPELGDPSQRTIQYDEDKKQLIVQSADGKHYAMWVHEKGMDLIKPSDERLKTKQPSEKILLSGNKADADLEENQYLSDLYTKTGSYIPFLTEAETLHKRLGKGEILCSGFMPESERQYLYVKQEDTNEVAAMPENFSVEQTYLYPECAEQFGEPILLGKDFLILHHGFVQPKHESIYLSRIGRDSKEVWRKKMIDLIPKEVLSIDSFEVYLFLQ